MKSSGFSEWKTYSNKEHDASRQSFTDRKTRIEHKFSQINKNFLSKTQNQTTFISQLSHHNSQVSRLDNQVEQTFKALQNKIQLSKSKLRVLHTKVSENIGGLKERKDKNASRIIKIKTAIELELKAQRYISDLTLKKISDEYEKLMSNLYKNKQSHNHSQLLQLEKKSLAKLKIQTEEIKSNFEKLKVKKQDRLEHIISTFEEKILLWKQKMSEVEMQYEQLLKKLKDHVESARNDIKKELQEERKTREERKEKILSMFEINCESMIMPKAQRTRSKY